MDPWVTQWRKGLMEYCILCVLRRGESYGYEIVQALRAIEALAVSESTVYPILTRLRDEHYLKVRDVPSPSGPPRRYFSLTSVGRVRLVQMDSYWEVLTSAMNELRNSSTKEPLS